MRVVSKGRSAHAASNQLGDNAIYSLLPVMTGIRDLEPALANDDFLGHGKITVTDMKVETPSINAVPNKAEIYIDRRLTFGETKEQAILQVENLIPNDFKHKVKVEPLVYAEPSYTGFTLEVEKYFPAWAMDEDHLLVQSGLEVRRMMGLADAPSGKWEFSTNGIYWAGMAGIPSIGFAPGDEDTAHTSLDSVPIDELVKATEFYALLPKVITKFIKIEEEKK